MINEKYYFSKFLECWNKLVHLEKNDKSANNEKTLDDVIMILSDWTEEPSNF